MPKDQIRQSLKALHEELASVDHLDAELNDLLRAVDSDIHSLLEEPTPSSDQTSQLMLRLEALGADFAARHPTTERLFQELIAMLGRLGI
jgi:hypothetical protein